ncbi:MAG: GNAT family N-acetyltransferase [Balneolaceae bacterium]|nr:GNAT family N-acetyltransferase [Balneolaceae bacterium]
MQWKHITRFSDFPPSDLYEVLKLRQDVFIIEQDCIYGDMDGKDVQSEHLLIIDDGLLAGYSRIVPAGLKFEVPSIGRIVVRHEFRGRNFGRKLVEKSIEIIREEYTGEIKIEAQFHLQFFYNSLGFVTISEAYNVDGIPHIEMSQHI